MSGFLEGYGAGEERRERLIKRAALSALAVAVLGGGLWFWLRNWREERQVSRFLELLQRKDYPGAYHLWGCTETKPCRDYSFEKFLEDWGPKSTHTDLATLRVVKTRSCRGGIIKALQFPGDEVLLWVERKDLTLGYAPWPVCNPRIPSPL